MRSLNPNLSPKAKEVLHNIMLLVENDEIDYSKGCNWNYVKSNIKGTVIKKENDHHSIISKNAELKMWNINGIGLASCFLKYFRHAFCHNSIWGNPSSDILTVDLKKSRKYGEVQQLKGTIRLSVLTKIVELIKESRTITKTNKNV